MISVATQRNTRAFTYVELLIAVSIAGLIMLALMGVVNTATESGDTVKQRNDLVQQVRFALNRMVDMTGRSPRLLLPLKDKTWTNWPENIREQTIPASPPVGDSSFARAVLAVTLPHDIDLDQDGIPDADDDGDGLFDEDLPNDSHYDYSPGIVGIDDDGDGNIDEGDSYSDDESTTLNDDPINGVDDDGDNNVDEDPASDINDDGCPGICGVDDDGDGDIDEGSADDDDEDGDSFDDPYNPVVYYLNGSNLVERLPARWDTDGQNEGLNPFDGRDFIESTIADNVTRFRVERVDHHNVRDLIDLTLELTDPVSGETVSLQTMVRVGGAL